MTPVRFVVAMVLFHAAVLWIAWVVRARSRGSERAALSERRWWRALLHDVAFGAVETYGASLTATVLANLDGGRRLLLGEISLRLLGQALFGEAILLSLGLAWVHRRARRPERAIALGAITATLLFVYMDAFRIEPQELRVRRHTVDEAAGDPDALTVRILHVTDIQTPAIGEHEERALRAGLASRPDLVVFTGDYVQDAMGRHTEEAAARDLRALITRIGFDAPLGVFATDGDVGPPCAQVFAGSRVRCLVDASAVVTLPGGGTLGITGLSRNHGRERKSEWLAWLLSRGPGADRRLVISHSPDFVDALPVKVDLVLAGHTHGGQVVIPLFGAPSTASRLPRVYAGGLHDFQGTPLHVSRGVGMERGFAPPVRFLCPPEVCILDMRVPGHGMARSAWRPAVLTDAAAAPDGQRAADDRRWFFGLGAASAAF